MDVSYLQTAVNKLRPIYHTPKHIIDKIRIDQIYGNPPFARNKSIEWSDIKECALLGLTIRDTAHEIGISYGRLREKLAEAPEVNNLFDHNTGRASTKAKRGYNPDSEMPPMKFKDAVFDCANGCGCKVTRTNGSHLYCKPCARIINIDRCAARYYRTRKLKGTGNKNHPWRTHE